MNAVEKVCLDLCEEIFCTSSVTDKTILNYSVKLRPGNEKTAEVVLVTKEDEYTFILELPEEVYWNKDSHHYQCSKCALKNKYNLKCIKIKGFEVVEFGKINLPQLKMILEKLAEDHARCIEENNLEKKNFKTGLFSVSPDSPEHFTDILGKILGEVKGGNIDSKSFVKGIEDIEKSYETLLDSEEEFIIVYGNILQNKLFVKGVENYKILNIRSERNFPLVFDLLLSIFSFTDQKMRQHHYHELLDHYYKSLERNLKQLSLDISKCLPWQVFQKQLHVFLSPVKLEILKQFCHRFVKENGKTLQENLEKHLTTVWNMILEVQESILYKNLSREDCYEIVRNKIKSSDYNFLNYKMIPLQEREGFLGDYYRLKIEIEHHEKVELYHFFAKYLPTYNDMAKDLASSSFEKEEFYYMKLIDELNDLGLEDITDFLPKCYFSRTHDVLVFDDLSAMNYKTYSVSFSYTYEMLLITIKQLAKVHACSLLYEELLSKKNGETVRLDLKFPAYTQEKNIIKTEETLIGKTWACANDTMIKMLEVFPDIPKKLSMEEFKKRAAKEVDNCYERVKKSERFRNVLCQGDAWASNILFKTDKDNSPIDCRLVDYQLTRYCPPPHDLYYFFYMATDQDTRKKYEPKLLQEYYSELSRILQKYNVDLQKIYTYQEFLDCCEYMRSQGWCHGAMVLQFVLFDDKKLKVILDDREQTDRLLYVNRDIFVEELKKDDNTYARRMKELVEELYEICEKQSL